MAREVVADALVVINLHATGRERALLEALGLVLVMEQRVGEEDLFMLGPYQGDDEHERQPIDLGLLERAGFLRFVMSGG